MSAVLGNLFANLFTYLLTNFEREIGSSDKQLPSAHGSIGAPFVGRPPGKRSGKHFFRPITLDKTT